MVHQRQSSLWRRFGTAIVFSLLLGIFLPLDLFPHFGPPSFRYTGSDPASPIWNLGWPVVLIIYDARNGLHWFPGATPLFALQALILVAVVAAKPAVQHLATFVAARKPNKASLGASTQQH